MLQHLNYLSDSILTGVNTHNLMGPEGNQTTPHLCRTIAMLQVFILKFNGKIKFTAIIISEYLSHNSLSIGSMTEN